MGPLSSESVSQTPSARVLLGVAMPTRRLLMGTAGHIDLQLQTQNLHTFAFLLLSFVVQFRISLNCVTFKNLQ